MVSFATSDGIGLEGRLFGQGQTGVVLAHMFPTDQSSWWTFAQELTEEGYMALTFDFRGFGKSRGEQDIDLLDRDVEAGVDFLASRGAQTVFLIGASMGGTASLKLAARQLVPGVVSLSAPITFKELTIADDMIRVPVLLMVSEGDRGAKKSMDDMIEGAVVGGAELTEQVLYLGRNDHGTDILIGPNGDDAQQAIFAFLREHGP